MNTIAIEPTSASAADRPAPVHEFSKIAHDLAFVACFPARGMRMAYPLSHRDVEADTRWASQFLSFVGVVPGDTVAVSVACSELGHFWPYECAIEQLDACVAMAENVNFDARRTEMFLRRFQVRAAFGVSDEILNGLDMAGLPLKETFVSTPLVFARDSAADRLKQAGLDPWRMVTLGPLFAFVSPQGKVHYDRDEWLLECIEGEVHVTARHPRAKPLFRLPVGVKAQAPADGHDWRFA
ncbi:MULTISPECIES: hypothetical protein [Burkholderia]|uniref:hypothetical protein n=1 Tax=Burkholderia TaxID=32008 RepID=UPI0015886FA6|nr:hypothetical protein [Burkholderia seminalis]